MVSKYGWFICSLLYFLSFAFWFFSLSGKISSIPDASFYFYPLKNTVVDFLRQGLVPLWNPYVTCGSPLLADWQSACCYPFTWARAWLDISNRFENVSLLHELLAFGGFHLWLRRNRVGRLWSVLGAMGYAGSAQMIHCWGYNSFQATLAWVPFVFWSAQSYLELGGIRRWVLMVLVFSLELVSGYPPFSFYTFVFLGVWAAWFRPGVGHYRCLILGGLTSLLLTSAQWLPFLEFLSNGQRILGDSSPYHFSAGDFSGILNPFHGENGSLEYRGGLNPMLNPHIGIPALVLLIWAFFKPVSKKSHFWAVSSMFILIWLAGQNGPAAWLLPSRVWVALEPSKAAFVFIFSGLTASVHQGNGWLDSKRGKKSIVVLIVIIVWVLEMLVLPFGMRQHMPNPYLDSKAMTTAQVIRNAAGEGRVLQVMTSLDYSLRYQENLRSQIVSGIQMMEPDASGVFGIRTLAGHLSLAANGFMNLVRYGNKAYPYPGRLLDVAGVKVFICKRKMPGAKYEPIPFDGKFILNINKKALPSLREVDGMRYFENRPSALEATALENAEVEKEVYLEKDPKDLVTSLSPGLRQLAVNGSGETKTSRASPQRALWLGKTHFGSYVVFNETFFPGWKAWLDGRPVPIYRAYGQFMAVRVDQKSFHRIDFGYEPASFRLGLFISLCSASLLFGLSLKGIYEKHFSLGINRNQSLLTVTG